MQFNILSLAAGGGSHGPPDPPPPPPVPDINQLFDLQLRADPSTFHPFRPVTVAWRITPKADLSVDNYTFGLIVDNHEELPSLAAEGTFSLTPYRNTLLRVGGRPRDAEPIFYHMLPDQVWLTVDESACIVRGIPSGVLDWHIINAFSEASRKMAHIRRRRELQIRNGVLTIRELEVEPSWESGVIRYYFPLTLLLNNFYNADYDLRLAIRFVVHHGEQDVLEVRIDDSSNFDFSRFEDITSFGSTAVLAKGLEKVAPLILECKLKDAETALGAAIMTFVQGDLNAGARLLDVRVVPSTVPYLDLVLCQPSDMDPDS